MFGLYSRVLSSQGHPKDIPSQGSPKSWLQKPHPTLLPHFLLFLPAAGLQSPGRWLLPFLLVILNTQSRLRQEQGYPSSPQSPICISFACTPIISQSAEIGRASGPLPCTSPGKQKQGLPHSSFLLSDLHRRPKAEDQRARQAWGKWAVHSLSLDTHGSPSLL